MEWLREQVGGEVPAIAFEDFVAAMMTVSQDIVRARPPEHYEVLSQERFRRSLVRVGVTGEAAVDLAQRLSQRHMDYLASTTFMPPEHGAMLETLASRCTIGLISNFDHAPTVRRLLAENDIERLLRVTVFSADCGRRKPHPSIFHGALATLGADAGDALYVGDTFFDDVSGARAAGMDVVWINAKGAAIPAGSATPTYIVNRLTEISALLR
jgi:HAD superfamily hydrolase (TIGR01549 family)